MRLTLRTLLAYLDDTLDPAQAAHIGHKLAENPEAQKLAERIRKVTRRRGLSTPPSTGTGSDPNTVANYLSDTLTGDQLHEFEKACLESDPHLAEVAACHQILTLLLSDQVRVPPTAYRRMYGLVKGREAIPGRKPGNVIPVGGAMEPTRGDHDDSDAPFLLGLTAGDGNSGRVLLRWGLAAALAAGFVLAVVMVWPTRGSEVAQAPTGIPTTPPSDTRPTEPPPKKEPVPKVEDPKEPAEPFRPMPAPAELPPDPPAMPPVRPMPPVEPKNPLLELVPAKTPTRPGRFPVAKLDAGEPPLLARKADGDIWTTVTGEANTVFTSDRVVCVPGVKVKVKTGGGQVLLWGNVPELQPIPVLDTTVTFHDPYQGYEADLTLHVGRVYLTADRPTGAKFRVRFQDEIWDVTVLDDKTEVVVQVDHLASPAADESPTTFAACHVNAGTAAFRSRQTDAPKVAAGEGLFWTSSGAGLMGPQKPDAKSARQASAYYSRTAIAPNADAAKAMLTAIDAAGKRLAAAATVPAAVSELISDNSPAAPRLGVYTAAAIGEFGPVADALNDPKRFLVREAGRQAARQLVALPGGDDFVKAAAKKLRLEGDDLKLLAAGLRGLTDRQKTSAEVIDLLVKELAADEVAVRDLAYDLLVFQVDPTARDNKALFPFDAAAPAEARKPVVEAWKAHAAVIKRKN